MIVFVSVVLSVPLSGTQNCLDWRFLVKEPIAAQGKSKITLTLEVEAILDQLSYIYKRVSFSLSLG